MLPFASINDPLTLRTYKACRHRGSHPPPLSFTLPLSAAEGHTAAHRPFASLRFRDSLLKTPATVQLIASVNAMSDNEDFNFVDVVFGKPPVVNDGHSHPKPPADKSFNERTIENCMQSLLSSRMLYLADHSDQCLRLGRIR